MPTPLDLELRANYADICGPGGLFETTTVQHQGRDYPIIKNAPVSLPAMFAQCCKLYGDADFLIDGDLRLSFAQTYAAAQTIALHLDLAKGARVGIAARNSANAVLALMAVSMAGGCATLLNGWWTAPELIAAVELAECSLVLADPDRAARLQGIAVPVQVFGYGDWQNGFADVLAHSAQSTLPELAGDDLATILFTSGSTGTCKGAWSNHRAVVQGAYNFAAQTVSTMIAMQKAGEVPPGQPCTLLNVPMFHITGLVPVLLQSFIIGRKVTMLAKWDAREAMRLIEAERVSYFVGVPLMSYEIATHPDRGQFDLTSCKSISAGGAARPIDHVAPIQAAMPNGYPLMGYGLTETNAVGTGNINQNYLAKPASAGWATPPLVELAIINDAAETLPQGQSGEVAIRSVCNFGGYWNDPAATSAAVTAEHWFRTGDLGYLDEDGYLFLIDRIKDIIIRGGENIACLEVEEALYAHPDVAEACVFGLPDARLGEVPVAVWLGRTGATLDENGLRQFLHGRLAAFKQPVRLWQAQAQLPRLGTEKIDKRALKLHYGKDWKAE